jgi:hypothetical protein
MDGMGLAPVHPREAVGSRVLRLAVCRPKRKCTVILISDVAGLGIADQDRQGAIQRFRKARQRCNTAFTIASYDE